jgi:hypothetical protein
MYPALLVGNSKWPIRLRQRTDVRAVHCLMRVRNAPYLDMTTSSLSSTHILFEMSFHTGRHHGFSFLKQETKSPDTQKRESSSYKFSNTFRQITEQTSTMTWDLELSARRFLQWCSKNSDDIIDRICCCSYLDSQVCGEVETRDHYNIRSTTLPTEFIVDDIPMASSTRPSSDLTSNRPPSPTSISPSSSFESMSTVSISSSPDSFGSNSTLPMSHVESDHGENYRIYPAHSCCETELTMGSGSNFGTSYPTPYKKPQVDSHRSFYLRQHHQLELMTHAAPSAFQDMTNIYLPSLQRHRRNECCMEMIHQVQTEGLAKISHLRGAQVGYQC